MSPMDSNKYPFRVVRVTDLTGDCGQHKTRAAAEKRVARLVSMSNGKRSTADFLIIDDSKTSERA